MDGDLPVPLIAIAMQIQLDEERLRQLIEVGPWLLSQLDLETVLDRLLQTARDATGARYAALGVLDVDRRHLERFLTRGLSDEEELEIGPRPRGRGILGLLTAEPKPLRLADLSAHPSSFGFPAKHPPMRSFLGVPIMIAGSAWGNLYLTDKEGGSEFDEADEQAATILAAWAAIAIEHSRALAAASERQAALEQTLRRLEATQAIVVAVGAETNLSRVLDLIAERGRVIAEARSVIILLQDGEDLVTAAGAGQVSVNPGTRIPIAESTSGQVMLSQRSARIADAEKELRVPPQALGVAEGNAALIVPLVYRGRALGVLCAFDRDGYGVFTDEDEQLLASFGASAATAVATAQTVQADSLRHSMEAAEAERKHWARELHDETLQALGGLKILASSARRHSDPEMVGQVMDQLVEGIDTEIDNVHSIINSLRPAALDDLGLRPAIEALAEHHRVAEGLEIEVQLELPDPAQRELRLAPELEVTVYRLVQEALTNIVKHSHATRVDVIVAATDRRVEVRVTDDGEGFDAAKVSRGFGLVGMRERVGLAGGELEVTPSSAGTTVAAVLPARYVS
jgi:signal transduction histidine kinase